MHLDNYAVRDAAETKRILQCAKYYIMPDNHFDGGMNMQHQHAVITHLQKAGVSLVDTHLHKFGTRGEDLSIRRDGPAYAHLLLMAGDLYHQSKDWNEAVDLAINTEVSQSEDHFDYDTYNGFKR